MLMKTFRKYRDDHLSHHANNGDYENDAEFAVIQKFGLHDALTWRTIFRHMATPLMGRHLRAYTGISLSGDDGRFFVFFKLALLAIIVAFTVFVPLTSFAFVIIPLFYIYPTLNFWTDCLDHAGLVGAADELESSRNVLAPAVVRLLFFPLNDFYHLVHHLFPQIPARHLDVAHAELCKDPSYRGQPSAVRAQTGGFARLQSIFFGSAKRMLRIRTPKISLLKEMRATLREENTQLLPHSPAKRATGPIRFRLAERLQDLCSKLTTPHATDGY